MAEKGKLPEVLAKLFEKYGNSSEESRAITKDAHGGIDQIKEAAELWASHHNISGADEDIVIAYVTAVDLGVRIGGGGAG